MEIILSYLCVFMINCKNIYIANIVFVLNFIWIHAKKKNIYVLNKSIFIIIAFLFFSFLSIIIFHRFNPPKRSIVSWIFCLQYIFVILFQGIDKERFYYWYLKFSYILSVYILGIFFLGGYYRYIGNWIGINRFWGREYIPAFPTGVIIILSMAVFIAFYKKSKWLLRIFLTFVTMLIPSRAGFLACVLIWSWFILKMIKSKHLKYILAISSLLLVLLTIYFDFLCYLIITYLNMVKIRLFSYGDRQDILYVCLNYLKQSPILGFGGFTLDTISTLYGNLSRYNVIWPHTHNWILEATIRYGILPGMLFICFWCSLLLKIKDKDEKFMYILLLFLALFQTYIQDFVFLMFLILLNQPNYRKKLLRLHYKTRKLVIFRKKKLSN